MREALSLAVLGWGQTSPNPLVGAVVIADGVKIGEGYHATFGGPHAEVVALDSSGARATGSTLYVTLEPCNHQGRTPPCVDTIIAAGVSRVVIATQDPNPVAAGGASRLRSAGIQVDVGILEDEARELNAAFLHSFTSERPWVTLKLAMSLDGAIAGPRRRRERLTNELSNAVVQRLRAGSDGIAVGVETAIADDPALTARSDPPPRIFPVRIVFDRSARLPTDSRLAATAREFGTVIVSSSTTPFPMRLAELGVDVLTARDLADALRKLRQRGIVSLLVEGGAGLAASFLAARFVDRMIVFHTPVLLGDGALRGFSGVATQDTAHAPRFRIVQSQRLGNDLMTTYAAE